MNFEQGYVKVDTVVRDMIADKGFNTLHKYVYYLKWALEGLRLWQQDHGSQNVNSIPLKMQGNNVAPFPDDMITWTKLGCKVGDRLEAFINDGTLTTETPDTTKNASFIESYRDKFDRQKYLFYNYTGYSDHVYDFEAYGHGHNGIGYFRPDYTHRRFVFSNEVSGKNIILEYIPNVFDPKAYSLVTSDFVDAMKAYIDYKEAKMKFGEGHGETQARWNAYEYELINAKGRISDLSYEGIVQAINRQSTIVK